MDGRSRMKEITDRKKRT